jgi:hypothetical protein
VSTGCDLALFFSHTFRRKNQLNKAGREESGETKMKMRGEKGETKDAEE